MVMVAFSEFKGSFGHIDSNDRPRRDAEFSALQTELLQRVEVLNSPGGAEAVQDNPVVIAASEILREFAQEAVSPCVMWVSKDTDPWDERVKHLREMAAMTSETIFEVTYKDAALSPDDPRVKRLELIVAKVAVLVSETLEASIEAVGPISAPSASPSPI